MLHTLDLHFLGLEHAIAAFLIETSKGPVLIETGPHSTLRHLHTGIRKAGYEPQDIKHVLLTHIHLDHAGAAWDFAKNGATIYVHPFGAAHLAEPSKLMESARMIYKEKMDRLWGKMESIDKALIHEMGHGEKLVLGDVTLTAWHTPGHARHHIAWQWGNEIFTGDVAGVKIGTGPVVPPCPPPDINLEDWLSSIDLILSLKPSAIYLTHFDKITDVSGHFSALQSMLQDWSEWIRERWEKGWTADELTPLFSEYTATQMRNIGVDEKGIEQYEAANPSWMSVAGLIRYWKKKNDSK